MTKTQLNEHSAVFNLIDKEEMLFNLLHAKTGPALTTLSVLIFLETEGWKISAPPQVVEEPIVSNVIAVDFRQRKRVQRLAP